MQSGLHFFMDTVKPGRQIWDISQGVSSRWKKWVDTAISRQVRILIFSKEVEYLFWIWMRQKVTKDNYSFVSKPKFQAHSRDIFEYATRMFWEFFWWTFHLWSTFKWKFPVWIKKMLHVNTYSKEKKWENICKGISNFTFLIFDVEESMFFLIFSYGVQNSGLTNSLLVFPRFKSTFSTFLNQTLCLLNTLPNVWTMVDNTNMLKWILREYHLVFMKDVKP